MNYNIWPYLALFNLFTTTAVFGATIVWDGGDGTGTALGGKAFGPSTNWVGDISPNSANGDICQWDGTVPGNLFLTASSANGQFNNGTPGVSFYIAAGHTGSLNIRSIVSFSQNIALNAVTIDSGAGAFSLGDGTANVLGFILRPSSSGNPLPIHDWVNNSTNAAVIYPNVGWQAGGGNSHVLLFDGTGDWIVTNNLTVIGGGNNNNFLMKAGSGTLFWSGPTISAAQGVGFIGSPLDFEGGTVVLLATNLLKFQRITNNGVMLAYAAPASQTLSGPIDGTGLLKVSNGTLTLSSILSDFSGNIVLTNGGVLVAGGSQTAGGTGPLGTNGMILFNGGTLQFSVANTFDYSPRFSTAANQAYSFNTGGQNVTFTNALTSSGGTLTKLGSGTLTLTGANTYTGATTVSNGALFINGSNTAVATTVITGMLGGTGILSGPVSLNAGTTLTPGASTGSVGTFTINSNLLIGGDLEFEVNKSLSQSNDLVIVTGVMTNTGTGTLTVSNLGPALAVGDKFTLFSSPVQNGAAMSIAGAGANWANNLAADGSIRVISIIPLPTLNFTLTGGNNLRFTWAGSFKLQAQTNSPAAGLGTNWVDFPGGGTSPVSVPLGVTNAAVFFRLASTF
jgi:autotransporter-associated beta strand protein